MKAISRLTTSLHHADVTARKKALKSNEKTETSLNLLIMSVPEA